MAAYKDLFGKPGEVVKDAAGSLLEKFGAPPFSVFDARAGYWQARKNMWIALGIKSEVGRGENLLHMSDTVLQPDPKKRAAANKVASFRDQDKLGVIMRDKKGGRMPNGKARAATFGSGGPGDLAASFKARAHSAIPGGGGKGKNSAWKVKTDDGYKSIKELQQAESTAKGQSASLKGGLTYGTSIHPYDGQGGGTPSASGTSIFDATLCDLFYNWFVPYGGRVLDPYAGGSVRGVVAGRLGLDYTGFDLRPEQVDANREQAKKICGPRKLVPGDVPPKMPVWIEGDSRELDKKIKPESVDAIFSCPPYLWLEQYSDDPRDLSTMTLDKFTDAYAETIQKAADALKPDRFACFVVGEVRDKEGLCTCFSDITNACFEAAGLRLYTRAVLITAVGSLSIRAARIFDAGSKLGNAHQEVLIYVKGSPQKATRAIEQADEKRKDEQRRPRR